MNSRVSLLRLLISKGTAEVSIFKSVFIKINFLQVFDFNLEILPKMDLLAFIDKITIA